MSKRKEERARQTELWLLKPDAFYSMDIEQKFASWGWALSSSDKPKMFVQIHTKSTHKVTISKPQGADWLSEILGDQAEAQSLQSLTSHKIPGRNKPQTTAGCHQTPVKETDLLQGICSFCQYLTVHIFPKLNTVFLITLSKWSLRWRHCFNCSSRKRHEVQQSRYSPKQDWSSKDYQQQLKYVFLKLWDSLIMIKTNIRALISIFG